MKQIKVFEEETSNFEIEKSCENVIKSNWNA